MARLSKAAELGLVMELSQLGRRNWRATLATQEGVTLFDRSDYVSRGSAHSGITNWLKRHYEPDTIQMSPDPLDPAAEPLVIPDPEPKPKKDTVAEWAERMRRSADGNEARAAELRDKADALEFEAKKLRAAADTLDG